LTKKDRAQWITGLFEGEYPAGKKCRVFCFDFPTVDEHSRDVYTIFRAIPLDCHIVVACKFLPDVACLPSRLWRLWEWDDSAASAASRCLAFAMVTHPRLGGGSPLGRDSLFPALPQEIVLKILSQASLWATSQDTSIHELHNSEGDNSTQGRFVTFAMVIHKRLGQESAFWSLDPDILKQILLPATARETEYRTLLKTVQQMDLPSDSEEDNDEEDDDEEEEEVEEEENEPVPIFRV